MALRCTQRNSKNNKEYRENLLWILLVFKFLTVHIIIHNGAGEVGKIGEGLKLHAAVDIDMKIITEVMVTKWHANDSPYLKPLLEIEKIEEVYADKGCNSLLNIRFVMGIGGG